MNHASAPTLERRHKALEAELSRELSRPLPDSTQVKRLKQLKLRIKDALAQSRPNAAARC